MIKPNITPHRIIHKSWLLFPTVTTLQHYTYHCIWSSSDSVACWPLISSLDQAEHINTRRKEKKSFLFFSHQPPVGFHHHEHSPVPWIWAKWHPGLKNKKRRRSDVSPQATGKNTATIKCFPFVGPFYSGRTDFTVLWLWGNRLKWEMAEMESYTSMTQSLHAELQFHTGGNCGPIILRQTSYVGLMGWWHVWRHL